MFVDRTIPLSLITNISFVFRCLLLATALMTFMIFHAFYLILYQTVENQTRVSQIYYDSYQTLIFHLIGYRFTTSGFLLTLSS